METKRMFQTIRSRELNKESKLLAEMEQIYLPKQNVRGCIVCHILPAS